MFFFPTTTPSPRCCAGALLATAAMASQAQGFQLTGQPLREHANGAVALMAFGVVPDLTSSFLSIKQASGNRKSLMQTQFTGGATLSKEQPLYLEGGAALLRYDPVFVASDGSEQRDVPTRWNTLSISGGVGWDFPLSKALVLRPMLNFAVGQVASDLSVAARFISWKTEADLDFLDNGKLNAGGIGGALMLDYESVQPDREIDVEARYTNIPLRSFGSTAASVRGEASAEALSLYARYRAPTGALLLQRPLRYVLEGAHTLYLGDQRVLLGVPHMSSLGLGLELDSSAHDVYISRTRLVARYAFGGSVRGFAVGLAMSF